MRYYITCIKHEVNKADAILSKLRHLLLEKFIKEIHLLKK